MSGWGFKPMMPLLQSLSYSISEDHWYGLFQTISVKETMRRHGENKGGSVRIPKVLFRKGTKVFALLFLNLRLFMQMSCWILSSILILDAAFVKRSSRLDMCLQVFFKWFKRGTSQFKTIYCVIEMVGLRPFLYILEIY